MIVRLEERSTALFPFLEKISLYGEKIISMIMADDDSLLLYSVGEPITGVAAVVNGIAVVAAARKEAAEELLFFLEFAIPLEKIIADGSFFQSSGDIFLLNRGFEVEREIKVVAEDEDYSLFEKIFDIDFNDLQNDNLEFFSAFIGKERVGGVAFERLYERAGLVSMLCTDERFRGYGVASALLNYLYKEGETLYIMSKNKDSDRFYNRLGLKKYGEYYLYEQLL